MISRIKRPIPNILITNGQKWTIELMGYVNSGQKIPQYVEAKYRHADIKQEIKLETEDKCIYCESFVSHQYPGDVEHIIPKSVYPRLTFTWNNLSFVCYWCNNHKRAILDKNLKLLNPYKDTISSHLRAFGPMIFHINDSKRGELTCKEIKLNRRELLDRRIDAIKDLNTLIDKYNRETSPALKDILLDELLESAYSDKEFSFVKEQFLLDNGLI